MEIIILIIFALFIFAAFYSGFYIGYYKREERSPDIIKKNITSKQFRRVAKEPEPTAEERKANNFFS